MNMPDGLSAEIYVWMRLQMTIAASRAVELMRADMQRVDDFANGLFVAFAQVLSRSNSILPLRTSGLGETMRNSGQ